jgi:hypothetical protein
VKFVSTREFRNRPGHVRALAQKDDLVLTAKGRPVGILVGVGADDLEEMARAIRQARAQRALSRMRREAVRRGLDRLPPSAVAAEIRAVRSGRKSK